MDFNEIIKSGLTLVDFWATWCGPCKKMIPILDSIEEEGLEIVKLCCDEKHNMEIAKSLNISKVPTLILFKDGAEIARADGYKTKEEIVDFVEDNR